MAIMFGDVKLEFIQGNGISNGDTTKRSKIFREYQLSVKKEDRAKGTWTLQHYEGKYRSAIYSKIFQREINMMRIKICIAIMLGIIVVGTLCGCGTSTNGTESSFEELDVDYTTNDNGTYTYEGNIYKHKIEVSGIEGESKVTFIVLANDTETSFEDVAYSLRKAEMSIGIPEFVILGWYY